MIYYSLPIELKNIHAGKKAFLFGAGYSVNTFDFNLIGENDIVLACNRSITAIPRCDYYCYTDACEPVSNYYEYAKVLAKDTAILGHFERRFTDPENFTFTTEDNLLIKGYDVCHVTAHFAVYLGCKEIILVGVDGNYSSDGKKYCEPTLFGSPVSFSVNNYNNEFRGSNTDGSDDQGLSGCRCTWKKIKDRNPEIAFFNTSKSSVLAGLFDHYPAEVVEP